MPQSRQSQVTNWRLLSSSSATGKKCNDDSDNAVLASLPVCGHQTKYDTMNYEQFIHTQRTGVILVSYLPYTRLSSYLHVRDDFPRLRCPTRHTHLGQQHQARLVQLGSLQQRQSGPGLKDHEQLEGQLRTMPGSEYIFTLLRVLYCLVPNQKFDPKNQSLQMFYSTVVGVMCSTCFETNQRHIESASKMPLQTPDARGCAGQAFKFGCLNQAYS